MCIGLCLVLYACGRAQLVDPYSLNGAVRASAVVTFTLGGESDLFALRAMAPLPWSHAAWIPVPPAGSTRFSVYTVTEVDNVPILFLATRQPSVPQFSIATVRVNSGPPAQFEGPPASAEAGTLPDWCENESWIAGFFIDGIGHPAAAPVVVEYTAAGSIHRLLVDPALNTVRGEPAFSIADADLSGATARDGRFVGVEIASGAPRAIPLLLARRGAEVLATAGANQRSLHWSVMGMSANPVEEWLFYLFAPIGGMPARDQQGALGC
jgi:hypothetical protein